MERTDRYDKLADALEDVDRKVTAIKRRSWIDWLLNGLGVIGVVGALLAFTTRASSADVASVDDKVRAVEAVQGVHTEAIGDMKESQHELKQALQRVEDKLDVLISR